MCLVSISAYIFKLPDPGNPRILDPYLAGPCVSSIPPCRSGHSKLLTHSVKAGCHKAQCIILYSMYVHYLHITTLYIHSYTYPPTLSSHMLTLLSPSMSTFISLNSRVVNMTMLALRFVARVVPFVYVPRETHDFSLPYSSPPYRLARVRCASCACTRGGILWDLWRGAYLSTVGHSVSSP